MFVSDNIVLMREWDFEKNPAIGLDPKKLKIRSNKKAWWRCSCGHSWQASIDKRSAGSRCPYCTGRKVLRGYNDLRTTHPDLANEWDQTANGQLTPEDVTAITTQKVSWVCAQCGHKWIALIRSRTLKGSGCRKCAIKGPAAKKRITTFVKNNGSLQETFPQLLQDWDYSKNEISPDKLTAHSNRKVWWKCHQCGHEWEAVINNRSYGRGCPCCSHKQLVVGKNDLGTTHPELAKEWHPTKNGTLTPHDVMCGQARKVWWLCPAGHSYQATVSHRSVTNGTNCPVCNSGRQTSFREQAFYFYLKQIFPDAINRYTAEWLGRFELDIYIPSQKLALEYDGVAWHKESNFKRERRKCSLCHQHGIKLIRIKEDMPNCNESHGLADEIISIENVEEKDNFVSLLRIVIDRLDPRSNMWTRSNPFHFSSPISIDINRDRYKILKTCSHVANSVAELHPDIAKEWHLVKNEDLTPDMFSCGSDFKAWWTCPKCGNEYETTISHRVSGSGCPKCVREKQAVSRKNNCAQQSGGIKDVRLLAEWNHEKNGTNKPEHFSPNSGAMVWWHCERCGYEWEAKISNRSHGRGCPCCAHRVVVKGKNDLATLYPELVKEWDYERKGDKTPDSITPGHNKKVWWKCHQCGHSYQAPPNRRTSQHSGCRKCADKMIWSIRRTKHNQDDRQMLLPFT